MDFDRDIRDYVLATLPYDPSKRPELEAKSSADLLITFLNWFYRLIPAAPRQVHQSKTLQRNSLLGTNKADFDQLVAKITAGQDLTPHLSTRVRNGYDTPSLANYAKRVDLDLMLAEWHVHHLHLSHKLRGDGFVERTGPLLFAVFTAADAFLIDIFRHGDWTKEAIAHILIDEWPQFGFVHEAKDIVGLERHVTEAERAELRASGISSPFIEHRGKFYMVGFGGVTSAGTPVAATRYAMFVMRAAKKFADHVAANPDFIPSTLRENGLQAPAAPELHLTFVSDGSFCIMEKNTGARFRLR
jgi:hypothetical protein